MLKRRPNRIPSIRDTIRRISISKNTIMRMFLALKPMALSILYISASSRHLPRVYRKIKIVTRILMMQVINTT
jgi:hypothetical protein